MNKHVFQIGFISTLYLSKLSICYFDPLRPPEKTENSTFTQATSFYRDVTPGRFHYCRPYWKNRRISQYEKHTR